MTVPSAAEPELLVVAAALLDTGRSMEALCCTLTALCFAGLLAAIWAPVPLGSLALLLAAAASGLAGTYAGARVRLDATLFRHLGLRDRGAGLLDPALLQLGMLPADKAGRPAAERIAGARRLLRLQALAVGVQAAALAAAGVVGAAG